MQNNIFSGLFVGQNLLTLKEVDSTNNFLKRAASNSEPLPEGTVIMAENQYAGRGQQQNQWHAEPGKNLTFSILLNPAFLPVVQQFDLIRTISISVFDTLRPLLGEGLKIKWPNDIYFGDKKLGGMLIENILSGNVIKHSIVGIGLNVNQETFPEAEANATSIKQILQSDYDLRTLLAHICNDIETNYLILKAGNISFVRKEYLNRLYWLNEKKRFRAGEHEFEGVITGVTDNGALIVAHQTGTSKFNQKEIEFLNKI